MGGIEIAPKRVEVLNDEGGAYLVSESILSGTIMLSSEANYVDYLCLDMVLDDGTMMLSQ